MALRAAATAVLTAVVLFTAPLATGQTLSGPATLVADAVRFDDDALIAEGKVEIFAGGRILRAERITYLRGEDRIEVEGPLVLLDGADQIVIADFASLGRDLQSSVLRGARLVLDRQLQIAATQIATGAEGRYTELFQTVASSCEVCAAHPVPLWQIRSRRIVHDREERQIYFENARFEVLGIPVAWLPVLRVPDPTLERATGVLTPRFISDDLLGTGFQVPYFIALGPSRDLTLTPFLSTNDARSLGFRYRQALDTGDIEVEGLVTRDDIRPGETRSYLFADGTFTLPRDYILDFQIELASDDDVLADYLITGTDLLENRLSVGRFDRNTRIRAEIVAFDDQRTGVENRFQPSPIASVERQTRVERDVLGGQLVWSLQGQARRRAAGEDELIPGLPPGSARDLLRASATLDWRRTRRTGTGLVWTVLGGLDVDAFDIRDDPDFDSDPFLRARPYAGVEARFPLARAETGGVRHIIEPVAQVIFAPSDIADTPDEDSQTPEFDEANLFSVSRFAGRDQLELGNRLNLGFGYTRHSPEGWTLGTTVGRVFRSADLDQFTEGSGLGGTTSDWLLSISAEYQDRFSVLQRSLLSDGLKIARSETILAWTGKRHAINTRFTFLEADAEAGRPIDTSEWALNASRDLTRDWTGRANWRYDFVTNDASSAGLGLTYRSDCVTVDMNVERRFTSNTTLQPTTRFGFGVELAGFGADSRRDRRRRCGI